jgi:hypothetical protein
VRGYRRPIRVFHDVLADAGGQGLVTTATAESMTNAQMSDGTRHRTRDGKQRQAQHSPFLFFPGICFHVYACDLRRGGITWSRMSSLFWVIASLFLAQNSLFDCLGKLGQRGRNTETTKQCRRCEGPSFANFPVFFPVSREFGAETGSHWTASSGWESGSNQRHVCRNRRSACAHGSANE